MVLLQRNQILYSSNCNLYVTWPDKNTWYVFHPVRGIIHPVCQKQAIQQNVRTSRSR